jgi:hypothetical protein
MRRTGSRTRQATAVKTIHISILPGIAALFFIVRKACTSSGSFGKPAYQQDEGGGNGKQKNNVGNVENDIRVFHYIHALPPQNGFL